VENQMSVYKYRRVLKILLGRARNAASRARPKRVPKTRRYFYTKIRFSTHGLS
jgi:hypothetical protein